MTSSSQSAPRDGDIWDSSPLSTYSPKEAAAWLAAVVANSDDAILSKNLDGVILTWNPGATALFGYSADEAIGQSITIIIPDDRLDEETDIIGKIRRGERVRHFETRRRHKDGSLIDISLTVSPVRDGEGRIIGASKIARDISEARMSAERQSLILREMNHRIKNLFSLALGLVSLSARRATSAEQLSADLSERLSSLARAHDLTLTNLAVGVDPVATTLQTLLRAILAPYEDRTLSRVVIEGCDTAVGPQSLPSLALLLHELATNAAKYGGLAGTGGALEIRTEANREALVLHWLEETVAGYEAPQREGFGTHLEKASLRGLGGEIIRQWRPQGLAVSITFPVNRLAH